MAKTIKITRKELYSKGRQKARITKSGKQPEALDKETLINLIKAMKQ